MISCDAAISACEKGMRWEMVNIDININIDIDLGIDIDIAIDVDININILNSWIAIIYFI